MKPVTHSQAEPKVVSRIVDLLIKQNKKQSDLTDYLGLHCNNFTEWKAGRKTSYLQYIDEIASFLDVSPTYLLRGTCPQEEKLLRLYNLMDDEKKDVLLRTAEELVR